MNSQYNTPQTQQSMTTPVNQPIEQKYTVPTYEYRSPYSIEPPYKINTDIKIAVDPNPIKGKNPKYDYSRYKIVGPNGKSSPLFVLPRVSARVFNDNDNKFSTKGDFIPSMRITIGKDASDGVKAIEQWGNWVQEKIGLSCSYSQNTTLSGQMVENVQDRKQFYFSKDIIYAPPVRDVNKKPKKDPTTRKIMIDDTRAKTLNCEIAGKIKAEDVANNGQIDNSNKVKCEIVTIKGQPIDINDIIGCNVDCYPTINVYDIFDGKDLKIRYNVTKIVVVKVSFASGASLSEDFMNEFTDEDVDELTQSLDNVKLERTKVKENESGHKPPINTNMPDNSEQPPPQPTFTPNGNHMPQFNSNSGPPQPSFNSNNGGGGSSKLFDQQY
jgi:hypothetical protein